jgi:hypothetical protein
MALYPEVQAKAQREIDTVIGGERLPTTEDREKLPYVQRLINEVLRWQPVTPLGRLLTLFSSIHLTSLVGVPHVCVEDDEYRGYRIPKGAIT